MTIVVNGQRHDLPEDAMLTDAIAALTTAVRGVAVALNGSVVPRGQWQSTALVDADQVEILTAVQGG
jgi:sulfur carrier protein